MSHYPNYWICNNISNKTGATCGAGSAHPSEAPETIPSFCGFVLLSLQFSMLFLLYYYLPVCLFLSLAMALSVYFQSMSLTVPLVFFISLLSQQEACSGCGCTCTSYTGTLIPKFGKGFTAGGMETNFESDHISKLSSRYIKFKYLLTTYVFDSASL